MTRAHRVYVTLPAWPVVGGRALTTVWAGPMVSVHALSPQPVCQLDRTAAGTHCPLSPPWVLSNTRDGLFGGMKSPQVKGETGNPGIGFGIHLDSIP